MLETNIRIVAPGIDLSLQTRIVDVITHATTPDFSEKACRSLMRRGIAAVVDSSSCKLLALTDESIGKISVEFDEVFVDLNDSGEIRRLSFSNQEDRGRLASLLERKLIICASASADYWKLDSPRIFYPFLPFRCSDGIDAFRRFELSSIPIDDVGVGIVIDLSTAFVTTITVADLALGSGTMQSRFEDLTRRQSGHKGTLIYDLRRTKHKCYFVKMMKNATCVTTGRLNIQDKEYASLHEYYSQKYPYLKVGSEESVALVSFPGMGQPKPVAARLLRIRVPNEALPLALKNVDKIPPAERKHLIENIWSQLGKQERGAHFLQKFWQPQTNRIISVGPPALLFANSTIIGPPNDHNPREFQTYFKRRLPLLREVGCVHVPPAMNRTIHIAVPSNLGEEIVTQLLDGITRQLSAFTKKQFTAEILQYSTLDDAVGKLRGITPGLVLFVFRNEDPVEYFQISYELKDWRVKRITTQVLTKKYTRATRDGGLARGRSNVSLLDISREWESFTGMNSLDLIQLLDCVPWTIGQNLNYDAQVGIDVGEDRRHYGVSILVCTQDTGSPLFLRTEIEAKIDIKAEAINHVHLRDRLLSIFRTYGQRSSTSPLASVLVLRDGHESGRELEGIELAREQLVSDGVLTPEAKVDVVDFHKRSVKGIRLWDAISGGTANHLLEGKGVQLDERTIVLANTGATTLHQGTAEPVMLIARSSKVNMLAVGADVFSLAQLNFSSPGVAQRIPITLKRIDDELAARYAQEIRRIG